MKQKHLNISFYTYVSSIFFGKAFLHSISTTTIDVTWDNLSESHPWDIIQIHDETTLYPYQVLLLTQ
jgi:hypothetical protein